MIYFYVSLITYIFYSIIKYRSTFYNLKKAKYNSKKYMQMILKNLKKEYLNIELIQLTLIIIALFANIKIIEIFTIIIYTLLFLYELKTNNKEIKKDKKLITRTVIIIIFYILLNIWFYIDYSSYHTSGLIFDNTPLYYIILIIIANLTCFITYIVNIISKPFDKFIK